MTTTTKTTFNGINYSNVNHAFLAAVQQMRLDADRMEAAGIDHMWSSAHLNLEFASGSLTDVVNANTEMVRAHTRRAADYVYGISDARHTAIHAL